jgi:hypothetical protein
MMILNDDKREIEIMNVILVEKKERNGINE